MMVVVLVLFRLGTEAVLVLKQEMEVVEVVEQVMDFHNCSSWDRAR